MMTLQVKRLQSQFFILPIVLSLILSACAVSPRGNAIPRVIGSAPPVKASSTTTDAMQSQAPYADHLLRIAAPEIWKRYDGTGQVIAVIDSGVNLAHPMLVGKIATLNGQSLQACFSGNGGQDGEGQFHSLCDNGQTSSFSNMAGQMSDPGTLTAANVVLDLLTGGNRIKQSGMLNHGTHVAGIAAGNVIINQNVKISGVAKGAKIIPIKIISQYKRTRGGQYLATHVKDLIPALEYVIAKKQAGVPIAAVNLSLGNYLNENQVYLDAANPVGYSNNCEQVNADNQKMLQLIRELNKMEVAVVAATGNQGLARHGVMPACLDPVIRVARSTGQDQYSPSDNIPGQPYVFAPGEEIMSAVSNNVKGQLLPGYFPLSGASQATPHVAGAIAIIRQVYPQANLTQIRTALHQPTDKMISGNGITAPRLNMAYLYKALEGMGLKPAPYK